MKKGGITIRKLLSLIMLSCFLFFFNIKIEAKNLEQVILGGDSIGLQMNSQVHVVGFYEIETESGKITPWKNANILEGDIIITIDDQKVTSNADIARLIKGKEFVMIKLQRKNEYVSTPIEIAINKQGSESLGIYIKDKILGIGTLTFINPQNNTFGALGHSVSSSCNSGNLLVSSIKSIRKATPGTPGEKYASLSNNHIGTITKNLPIGIFGTIDNINSTNKIAIQKASNVKTGKAQIVTVINGNTKEYFDIEIVEVKKQHPGEIKGMKIRITDQDLINATGGIIQGMSGSPILQDGYLVGALSHVVVNSPTLGYAVFAEWMYKETM